MWESGEKIEHETRIETIKNKKKHARKKIHLFFTGRSFFPQKKFHQVFTGPFFFAPDQFSPPKFLAFHPQNESAAGQPEAPMGPLGHGDRQRGTGISCGSPSPRVPRVPLSLEGRGPVPSPHCPRGRCGPLRPLQSAWIHAQTRARISWESICRHQLCKYGRRSVDPNSLYFFQPAPYESHAGPFTYITHNFLRFQQNCMVETRITPNSTNSRNVFCRVHLILNLFLFFT